MVLIVTQTWYPISQAENAGKAYSQYQICGNQYRTRCPAPGKQPDQKIPAQVQYSAQRRQVVSLDMHQKRTFS